MALNQEPSYSLICNALRFSFVGFMAITWLICYFRFEGEGKVIATLVVGYIAGVVGSWAYWDFASKYAPTTEIAAEIMSKDGAPRLFAPFIMPLFVGFFYLLLWPALNGIARLFPDSKATAD